MMQAVMKQMVVLPPSFLNIPQDNADISEEYLARRFSRLSLFEEKIEYECMDDIALLHQYNLLRGNDVVLDKQSKIIIARVGRLCVGGCHLNYNVQDDGVLCAEISEFSILPDYKNNIVISELLRQAIKQAAKNKAQFVSKFFHSKIKEKLSEKEFFLEEA